MFNGRHCTYKDYQFLVKSTDDFILFLKGGNHDQFASELDKYLDVINQFDEEIGDELLMKIKKIDSDYSQIIKVVETEIFRLKNNVLVDIQEHQ